MSFKNYTDFSKNNDKHFVSKELEESVLNAGGEVVRLDPVEKIHNEIMEDFTKPEITESIVKETKGVVSGCTKLNLREEANKDAKVLSILDKDTELVIELEQSTEDFYMVYCKDGKAGYCMKKFITIK